MMYSAATQAVIEAVIAQGARTATRRILDAPMEPHRVAAAIYGPLARKRPAAEMLADARRLAAAMEQLGRDGHWAFDANRLITLRQAINLLTFNTPGAYVDNQRISEDAS